MDSIITKSKRKIAKFKRKIAHHEKQAKKLRRKMQETCPHHDRKLRGRSVHCRDCYKVIEKFM